MKPYQSFTDRVIEFIRTIPAGRIATYGQIAGLAGNRRAARQVARILHACSQSQGLPWHRVVNRQGRVALRTGRGHEEQMRLLRDEGIRFDETGAIDLATFLWLPDRSETP